MNRGSVGRPKFWKDETVRMTVKVPKSLKVSLAKQAKASCVTLSEFVRARFEVTK